MIAYKIHLLRTGRTWDGPGKRYVGQSDPPLCRSGREELEELRDKFLFPRVEMVYTSPLSRCTQTAGILFPDIYTVEEEGFMDMNLGEFEGKTFDQLRGDRIFADWLGDSLRNTPPGGESVPDFTKRIIRALNGVFMDMMEEKITSVAVITHGGVIMTLLASIGLPKRPLHEWAVGNGCGYTLLMTPQMWMRDCAAEVFAPLPGLPEQRDSDNGDEYGGDTGLSAPW